MVWLVATPETSAVELHQPISPMSKIFDGGAVVECPRGDHRFAASLQRPTQDIERQDFCPVHTPGKSFAIEMKNL